MSSMLAGAAIAVAVTLAGCASNGAGTMSSPLTQAAMTSAAQSSAQNALGGMIGNMGVGSLNQTSAGNVAGVLNYCLSNNLATTTPTATSALGKLQTQPGVAGTPDFQSGSQGQLMTGMSNPISVSSLTDPLKQRVCNMVISRAQSLVGL
ncbi:hypothetical protein A0U93_06915 [Neoasaia chiangmaiensis]|uniref:DUF2501 domain-containing protein n=2 Tax=Neoasaia chiangmaiensis TaxID=320497 RepID=A0A1U9KPG9_9PROT|nr:hypothetical protein A0U93_06915 [Neoasaia chiangmaiensis]